MSQESTSMRVSQPCQAHDARMLFTQRFQATLQEYHQNLLINGNSLTHLNHVPAIVKNLTAQYLTQAAFRSLQAPTDNSFGFNKFCTLSDAPNNFYISISPMYDDLVALGSTNNQVFIFDPCKNCHEKILDATLAHFNKKHPQLVAINYTNNSLIMYDSNFNVHKAVIYNGLPEFIQRSDTILTTSYDNSYVFFAHNTQVIMWDVNDNVFRMPPAHASTIYCLAAHPANNTLLAVGDTCGMVTIYNKNSPMPLKLTHSSAIFSLCYNALGTVLAIGGLNTFTLYDTVANEVIHQIPTTHAVLSIDSSPNNAYFLFAHGTCVSIFDNNSERSHSSITTSDIVVSARFLADGSGIGVATKDGYFTIWHCSHYHTIANIQVPDLTKPFGFESLI